MPSLLQRLRAGVAAIEGPERFLDFRLDLTLPRAKGQLAPSPPLLTAGGLWDKTLGRFLDPVSEQDASQSVVVELQESQVELVTFGSEWLCDFREGRRGTPAREIQVALVSGPRRGGKSFGGIALVIATCVDVPKASDGTPLIAWIVCKSYRERMQLENWILHRIPVSSQDHPNPRAWATHVGAPTHEFRFIHGPTLRLLSADRDDATKQGRVDIAIIDEPQKMGAAAVANVILGASDLGGLTLLTANPPGKESRGDWMYALKEAIDDNLVALRQGKPGVKPIGVRYFELDPKKNQAIDQVARGKAGAIVSIIHPDATAGDVVGSWERPDERACYLFDKHKHLHAVPDVSPSMPDITKRVAEAAGFHGGEWAAAAGVDFQDRPHIVSSLWRCFGDPAAPTFWASGEFAGEKRWTEEEYLDAFEDRFPDLNNRNLAWVGDASGSWQDSSHSGKRTSFQVWKDPPRSWLILPPQDPKSDEPGARARNPFVDDQLQLVNELLRTDRLFIDPNACPWLAECFREAITKKVEGRRKIFQNKHAHALASALYVLWRLANAKRFRDPGKTPLAESFRSGRIGSGFRF